MKANELGNYIAHNIFFFSTRMEQNKNEIDIANSEDNRDDSDGYQYHMIITILDKIKLQEQDLVHKARGKGSSKRE